MTETMREAVARAISDNLLPWMQRGSAQRKQQDADCLPMADAAIRTVLERLREPTMLLGQYASHHVGCAIYQRSWASGEPPCTCGLDKAQAMLDAVVREVG